MDRVELNLKEIQDASFEVLLKIKSIFDENNWTYFLTYGTLIGAVRHNGFIPWDDDIDIWVPRGDYERFINYCIEHKEELKPFELFHYRTNKKYIYPIGRFSDTRYEIIYKNAKDYGLGTFVDVYPLDGLNPENFESEFEIIKKQKKQICIQGFSNFVSTGSKVKDIFKYPYYLLNKHKNLPKLLEKVDKYSQKVDFDKAEYFNCLCWADEKIMMKTSDLMPGINHVFNGVEFRIPSNYDSILRQLYGDYMQLPPEEERIAHHFYSIYKK